jgi:two-component system, OmpR family, sensor histidine kinase CiaH
MKITTKERLRRTTVIYWTLLAYIIAALVWWFITLEKQNRHMRDLRYQVLAEQPHQPGIDINAEKERIHDETARNTTKYALEGITFLILILIGAAFVFRSVRRQFRLQRQQQNFMMAVTHELKTPISVARLNLETMQKYSLEPERQKKLLRMTLEETNRLNFLTNNILISSQLEGGGYKTSREELDLSALLKDRINDFRDRFPDRQFSEEIEADTDIVGDPLLLQMLINNLIENAIKYSPKESSIHAVLKKEPDTIRLHIIDQGIGISEEEQKKIFNKFYRVGNESTRKTQGTGLGLYLCRIIARDHNADISVTNNTPRGSNFGVTFHI